MKKLSILLLAAGLFCSSCQQAPRPVTQLDVPVIVSKEVTIKKNSDKRTIVTKTTMVTLNGPEAREWDAFDRADALFKYNSMSLKDKEVLFETIARVYANLPKNNTYSSNAINVGIWKKVSDKGVDLAFGEDAADWHPYIMYVHPIVVMNMVDFYLAAKPGSITDKELNTWKKAFCNLINARPDNMTMAAILSRRDALAKAGITITESDDTFHAKSSRVNWKEYRAANQK